MHIRFLEFFLTLLQVLHVVVLELMVLKIDIDEGSDSSTMNFVIVVND